MSIVLTKEARQQAIESIKRYYAESMEDEVGDLKAGLLLDFFLKEIGPSVYNKAVTDAQAYFQEKLVDLDGVVYEPEFQHWK
jgi:uncharacterized protein (DUF2164 family)